MMVGISSARGSPTIRRRSRQAKVAPSSHWPHHYGIVACVLLVIICLWQTQRSTTSSSYLRTTPQFDVIVVGSGLAGLTTTLQALDRGGRVALVEKESTIGGNSLTASSGINACCSEGNNNNQSGDSLAAFKHDTTVSAGNLARPALIQELVGSSASTLQWLQERVGVDLSQVAQLGGHSFPRTHRPLEGMVGAELISHLEQLIRTYTNKSSDTDGHLTIYTDHPVTRIIQQHRRIQGVEIRNAKTNRTETLTAPQVVLATGGFASDRRPDSLLGHVRPDLVHFGTTGGSFSTGDGIELATSVGAGTTDLEQIQLHPTGFIDPQHPSDGTKVLAAELLRGVGGILLHPQTGKRFCNELGTRDYVTHQMLQAKAKKDVFVLVLTKEAAENAEKHVALYHRKGLLAEVHGVRGLAEWMALPIDHLAETLQDYQSVSIQGADAFGKEIFPGFPLGENSDWEKQIFFVGMVTPVLHYCMGGVSIDEDGRVLNEEGHSIQGLFAAGEVAGGVHGKNRLGGNSLLECAVFGRKIGQQLALHHPHDEGFIHERHRAHQESPLSTNAVITLEELQQHAAIDDMWMALHGVVYNFTSFATQHPGGSSILQTLAGTDATEAFATVHSQQVLQQFHSQPTVVMGKLDPTEAARKVTKRFISHAELIQHGTPDDCWVVYFGNVYDMTEFSRTHKGGAYLIQKYAGKDATDTFKVFHKKEKLTLIAKYLVGEYVQADTLIV